MILKCTVVWWWLSGPIWIVIKSNHLSKTHSNFPFSADSDEVQWGINVRTAYSSPVDRPNSNKRPLQPWILYSKYHKITHMCALLRQCCFIFSGTLSCKKTSCSSIFRRHAKTEPIHVPTWAQGGTTCRRRRCKTHVFTSIVKIIQNQLQQMKKMSASLRIGSGGWLVISFDPVKPDDFFSTLKHVGNQKCSKLANNFFNQIFKCPIVCDGVLGWPLALASSRRSGNNCVRFGWKWQSECLLWTFSWFDSRQTGLLSF